MAHTFLFADLVGFTALTDAEGDDRAAEVALGLTHRTRALAPAYGATDVKPLGDGVMVRCDDAGCAIELALQIVDQLDDAGFPPVRVGVHTGSAVSRDGDWFGRGVNVAARLCSVAAGGEVVVSETARSAAGPLPAVAFGERRLHWLRNVTEPVGAYSATGVPVRAARVRILARRRLRTSSAGRPDAKLRSVALVARITRRLPPGMRRECTRSGTGAGVAA